MAWGFPAASCSSTLLVYFKLNVQLVSKYYGVGTCERQPYIDPLLSHVYDIQP